MTFHQLYKEYASMSYNLALQYLQNNEDAEEVVQDVFLSVYQNLESFKQQSAHSTWIYRITINKCLDKLKSRNRTKRFAYIQSIFSLDDKNKVIESIEYNHPGVQLENKEQVEIVFDAINKLNSNQKTALILHKIEQLPQAQIAEIMGISTKAVESLIQRAKIKLSYLLNLSKD